MSDKIKLSQLKPNPNNPRLIKDDKFQKLVKSIKEFPEMLSKRKMICVTDTDGKMYPLGGNMRLKALEELKYKEIPKDWIELADEWTLEQRNEFLIKDNIGYGEWDYDVLANEWDSDKLIDWGLDLPDLGVFEDIDAKELFDIEIPFYVPSEIKPEINELYDDNNTKELLKRINKLEIDNELKDLLKYRASFFCDFNFQKIADYYYHSDNDIKSIFKDLGLIILAPKEALEKGFIELSENVLEL